LGYPSDAEELQMLQRLTGRAPQTTLNKPISLAEIQELRTQCQQIRVDSAIQRYMLDLVRATRNDPDIRLGVSPRGAVALHRATQAWAWLQGRDYVIPDDVKDLAVYVLAHRIVPASGRRNTQMITRLLGEIPIK
jgi:MoxR-like ATPase